ncbi:MAG: hypothetical protein D6744_17195 [Planctomycetota bacterium]|nr:MAG: hypothetical protein D6744_17195 [Planctomycetota bacterium]
MEKVAPLRIANAGAAPAATEFLAMMQPRLDRSFRSRSSAPRRVCAAFALLTGLTLGSLGCGSDVSLTAFRNAAASSLESGFKSIFDGLVEGFFAVFVQGDSATDSASSG